MAAPTRDSLTLNPGYGGARPAFALENGASGGI